MTAHPTTLNSLEAIVTALKALDLSTVDSAELVPLAKATSAVCAFAAALDAQIQLRAVANNELVPGVMVKETVTHRKWHDVGAAEELAREAFGDKAFTASLLSPAGIEKLGPEGKTFVAMASYKPEGARKAVY